MILLLCPLLVTQPALASEPQPSAILLKSGGVLQGSLSLVDGRYRVTSQGDEIRLPTDEVVHVGPSLLSLYEWQHSQVPRADARERIRLAEWCIRQQLWPQAARELLEARAQDSLHPRLELAERRLEEAWRQTHQTAAEPAAETHVDRQMAEAARAAQHLRLVEKLPAGSLEQFTRRIQPILENNCTTSGCHQPGGSESFQLNRNWLHGLADQRSTFANLAAVLAAIERENPDESPLLLAARQPHGGNPAGLLTGRRSELHDRLAEWVHGVTQPPAAKVARRRGPVLQPSYSALIGGGFQRAAPVAAGQRYQPPHEPSAIAHRGTPPALANGSNPNGPPAKKDDLVQPASFLSTAPKSSKPTAGSRAGQSAGEPRDEFDPEIFNRLTPVAEPQQ
ncbi:MAG: hypothetical protein AAGF31_13065 [Planctomycetota bacterium]